MTTKTDKPPVLDLFAGAYLRLWGMVENHEVQDSQWQAGRTPAAREDTSERSRGLVNDPTASIAVDTRRVNLREAVLAAEKALADADEVLRAAEATLESALARWPSETPES
jgi:hypothetical protein